jgi:hypothetical protein
VKSKPPAIIYNPEWKPEGLPRERWRCVENASRGLRVAGFADELIRLNHKGWFVDPFEFGGEVARGAVLMLPHGVYVPAIADPWNDNAYICDFRDLHTGEDGKTDAARAADYMAECYAETERDYRAKDAAEQAIAEARESICDARKTATRLVMDLRTAGQTLPPSVRETVRLRVRALGAEVSAAVKRIRTLIDNPFAIVEG